MSSRPYREPRTGRGDAATVRRHAVQCIVQLLFSTSGQYSIQGLRTKLKELLSKEANGEIRAICHLSSIELVTALLGANVHLAEVGLQLRITGGIVSLWAGPVVSRKLSEYLQEITNTSGSPTITQNMLEVLAGIALKQPVSQAEIDRIFGSEKRSQVIKLKDHGWVDTVFGNDGKIRWITTESYRQKFGDPAALQSSLDACRKLSPNVPSSFKGS